jgi:heat shock protein HslJ
MDFRHRANGDIAAWSAGCNYFGGEVEVTPDQLLIDEIASTAIGCPRPLLRQDRWLARVLDADPSWTLDGRHLTIAAKQTVIELRRKPGPAG